MQRLFNKIENLITHAVHHSVALFDDQHAWFTVQRTTFERIEEQIGHFGGEFAATRARSNDSKSKFLPYILRRHIRWNAIECLHHSLAQVVGVLGLPKWK